MALEIKHHRPDHFQVRVTPEQSIVADGIIVAVGNIDSAEEPCVPVNDDDFAVIPVVQTVCESPKPDPDLWKYLHPALLQLFHNIAADLPARIVVVQHTDVNALPDLPQQHILYLVAPRVVLPGVIVHMNKRPGLLERRQHLGKLLLSVYEQFEIIDGQKLLAHPVDE